MLILSRLIALAGMFISILSVREHILFTEIQNDAASWCSLSGTFDCKTITMSEYSQVFGIPLGVYGLVFYGVLLFLLVRVSRGGAEESTSRSLLSGLSVANLFVSAVLFFISKFVIGALCFLCLLLYVTSVLLFVVLLLLFGSSQFISGLLEFPRTVLLVLKQIFTLQTDFSRSLVVALLLLIGLAWGQFPIIRSLEAKPVNNILTEELWESRPRLDMFVEYRNTEIKDIGTKGSTAQVTLVEYFDYECPACRNASEVIEELRSQFGSSLQIIYRFFPLDSSCNPHIRVGGHASSCFLSSYAICSDEQGAFELVHKLIFDLAENYTESDELKTAFLESIKEENIDLEAVYNCMQSGRADRKIATDIESATRLKVMGTPSIYVNGTQVEQPSLQRLRTTIEKEIARSSN